MSRPVFASSLVALLLLSGASAARTLEHPPLGAGAFAAYESQDTSHVAAPAHRDTLRTHESFVAKHRFLRTTLEVVFINRVQNLMNRYVVRSGPETDQFVITWDSIKENIKNGFEWDDNKFITNHFAHPYNGALYFGAARANDYDFFHSFLFAAAGSWGWEFAGENNHPAVNDWINTSYGGATFGESLYRLSTLVLDNRATGGKRILLELGAGVLSPGRFLNRMVTGEGYRVHQNPPGHEPDHLVGVFETGARMIGDDHVWEDTEASAFISFATEYGDPFSETLEKPFDTFDFGIQFNFDSPDSIDVVGYIDVEGWLFGANEYDADHVGDFVAGFSHFNFYSNEVYRYGSQEIGAGYLNRYRMGERYRGSARVDLNAILLGASKADHFNVSGRDYDYGPGMALELKWALERDEHEILSLEQDVSWIHAIDGNIADHFIFMTDARFQIPIHDHIKLGVEYLFYAAFREYKDYPDVDVSAPELRLSAAFDID